MQDQWSALYDVRTVLISIQSLLGGESDSAFVDISLTLLSEPNNDSPLNGAAAGMWDDQVKYKEYLHKHYEQEVTNKK